MNGRIRTAIVTCFGLLLVLAEAALAQSYPSRAVKVLVPFPTGSTPDSNARLAARQLQEALGQPFVVENRPGALGTIAAAEVARSAPDGYTLLLATNTTHAQNVSLYKQLSYDPVKDFAPVMRISTTALMLVVRADFPAQNLRQFLTYARAHTGELSAGYGSAAGRITIGMLKSLGAISVLEVPYKGVPQAVSDVLAGHVSFTFCDFAVGLAQIKGGKMRALGVTSPARTPLAPDLPALAEEMPGFELNPWYGLVAPAGTPRDVIGKLYDVTSRGIGKPEERARLATLGLDVAILGPDEFGEFIKKEIALWAKRIKDAGILPE
jgi:tripartite-type tricarboxylate transporter receptor subunit TctC